MKDGMVQTIELLDSPSLSRLLADEGALLKKGNNMIEVMLASKNLNIRHELGVRDTLEGVFDSVDSQLRSVCSQLDTYSPVRLRVILE